MTLERKITIGAVLALVIYVGTDVFFHFRDKLAQAKIEGLNQGREEQKTANKTEHDALVKQMDAQSAADQKDITDARQTISQMADYVNKKVPNAPGKIEVHTGPLETVTLHTGDAVIPAAAAPFYFDAFAAGQTCQDDLKKCGVDRDYNKKQWDLTQNQYDDEKNIKRRSKWSILGEAGCGAGAALLSSRATKDWRVIAGATAAASTACGLKF